jgi:uncharacterized protein YdeI (YjbR/CyaY-like superfamily)
MVEEPLCRGRIGSVTRAGLAKVQAAQASGQRDFPNDVDALAAPDDLVAALDAAGRRAFWAAMPRSVRQGALEWIKTARAPTTRAARIADVEASARQGLRPSPFRRK